MWNTIKVLIYMEIWNVVPYWKQLNMALSENVPSPTNSYLNRKYKNPFLDPFTDGWTYQKKTSRGMHTHTAKVLAPFLSNNTSSHRLGAIVMRLWEWQGKLKFRRGLWITQTKRANNRWMNAATLKVQKYKAWAKVKRANSSSSWISQSIMDITQTRHVRYWWWLAASSSGTAYRSNHQYGCLNILCLPCTTTHRPIPNGWRAS